MSDHLSVKNKKKKNLFAYIMLAPDLIGLTLFIFVPVCMSLYVSLHSWNALSVMKFTGLDNYLKLLGDAMWWKSLGRTASDSMISGPGGSAACSQLRPSSAVR